MNFNLLITNKVPKCDHKKDTEDYNLCSLMRNISVNGVQYVLKFLHPGEILEFILLVTKLQKLEAKLEYGINFFLKMTQNNSENIDRRNLFVKLLTMLIKHPFFVWGHNHKIIETSTIFQTITQLTNREEIKGDQIKNTIKNIDLFLEWSRRMRKCGLI